MIQRSHIPRDAYLWDRSGPPDPEIVELERVLAAARWQPSPAHRVDPPASSRRIARSWFTSLRIAASLGVLIAGAFVASIMLRSDHIGLPITALGGSPRVGERVVAARSVVGVGQWVQTDADSTAEITVGGFGTVTIEPGTRLRLVQADATNQRLQLDRGSISAFITAPPRLFVVQTPAVTAYDLGCAYRLWIDDAGDGGIEVTLGWVSLERGDTMSIVPFGARCEIDARLGAGTPYYPDATPEFKQALRDFDFQQPGQDVLAIVIAHARSRDSLTLWHLLARTRGDDRRRVLDRLLELTPQPADRSAILRGDPTALEALRDQFIWSPRPPTSFSP